MLRPPRDDPAINPNSLHQFHAAIRGPKDIPNLVVRADSTEPAPIDPGHPYARTSQVSFNFFQQRKSNAPFGYEYFVSLPPSYDSNASSRWPLILFLHGSGESQRSHGESYVSLRHGIPKVILCYDRLQSGLDHPPPCINIPRPPRQWKNKKSQQGDKSNEPVPTDSCVVLAENFVTVTPSLNMRNGYGWSPPILSALLDEILERYRIDVNRIHLTGFSMGGYGVWDLALHGQHRFASLTPICGGADPARASELKHMPCWIHHGAKDDVIPAKASQIMYDALLASGNRDVKFSCYAELMHDSWTAVYNNKEIYEWILSFRRLE
jgi:predicted peptidase